MHNKMYRPLCMALGLTALVALAGCSQYVKRSEFDSTVAELRQADSRMQQQIDALSRDMQQRFARYDTRITALEGRIRVDTVAHFGFDESILSGQDKAMLDDFASVMREHHADALVTVEGFTDPAGPAAYNKRLGRQRAEAVRDYLVGQGMNADQLRAVSYGEDVNRQVEAGAAGDAGSANRRVTLVVDFAGGQRNS